MCTYKFLDWIDLSKMDCELNRHRCGNSNDLLKDKSNIFINDELNKNEQYWCLLTLYNQYL